MTNLSADLLDGADGSSYRNQTFVYTLTGSAPAGDTAWALPGLPPGKYLASYSMALSFSPASSSACYFSPANGSMNRWTAITLAPSGSLALLSASSYIDTTADPFVLGCQHGGTVTSGFPGLGPSKVVLTRVDDVTTATSSSPTPLTVTPKGGKPALQR